MSDWKDKDNARFTRDYIHINTLYPTPTSPPPTYEEFALATAPRQYRTKFARHPHLRRLDL